MPLSEQEQRLLDEMERHLLSGDADVVRAAGGTRAFSPRNLVLGAVLFIIGVVALITGVAIASFWGTLVGVGGFAAMLAGVVYALTPVRVEAEHSGTAAKKQQQPQRSSQSFMDRMNDRWDKRHGES
jgi:hypothetical protein